ncbi:hypothetical protein [Niastella sp. OAS944]|uniref:hypothetical protein n=1 Tax=Niastella sp. OAS944 TaxID=2664089 RepID=UPI00346D33FA|nr:hypothetical protein [Chitinophagaceae bacterium OAS944]
MLIIIFFHLLLGIMPWCENNGAKPLVKRWAVAGNSSLNIEGRSNLSPFCCEVTKYLEADTLQYIKNETTRQFVFNNSRLNVNINDFDCHQRIITNDFRKTLKADQNRFLKIQFICLDAFDVHNPQIVRGKVEIQLAGQIKCTTIDFRTSTTSTGLIQMNGTKALLFSEFNLTPPKKFAGIIKIKEEITVHFQLFFKPVE